MRTPAVVAAAAVLVAGGGIAAAAGLGHGTGHAVLAANASTGEPTTAAPTTAAAVATTEAVATTAPPPTTAYAMPSVLPTSASPSPTEVVPPCTGAAGPVVRATATPAADDPRLHSTYESDGYRSTELALGNFRMDPAPASVQPKMTQAQAVSVAKKGGWLGGGTAPVAKFGLFSGKGALVGPPPNHTLEGNVPITCQPAWIVYVTGQVCSPAGGAPVSGNPAGQPKRPKPSPTPCGTVETIDDATGKNLGPVAVSGEVTPL